MTSQPDMMATLLVRFIEATERQGYDPALVLLVDKRPCEKGWPDRRPTEQEALSHLKRDPDRHAIGIQPASLGCVVLDCDEGDGPETAESIVLKRYGEVVASVTPSTSGSADRGHVWIRCNEAFKVGNWKFSLERVIDAVSGDMRSTGGQVRLTTQALKLLADAFEAADGLEAEAPLSAFQEMRTTSARELDMQFDRSAGTKVSETTLAALSKRLEGPDGEPRYQHLFALAGDLKVDGVSFDAALDLLSHHAPLWPDEYGNDDGKYFGQNLDRHLVLAWRKLPQFVAATDDFEDDLDDEVSTADAGAASSPRDIMKKWVFVADAMKFIRRDDLRQFKPDQWNALHASLEPDGSILTKVWKGKTPVRRFEALAYVPGRSEVLPNSTYNIWRKSGVEPEAGDVGLLLRHLEYLLPDDIERQHIIDFMHFVCVRTEVKVRFAPLLQGEQGTGKTALGELLKRIIGQRNVAEPSPDELKARWTKWQEGASLALVEELMTNGRLELANKLKPVITNETLRIEDKGAPLYSIPNHLNMLCFTNFKNAVRLEAGDRRWLVLFSPAEPKERGYYDQLFRFINGPAPGRWLAYLIDHKPLLDPNGRAPMTSAKSEMREASMTDLEVTLDEWMASRTGPMANGLFRFEDAWDTLPKGQRATKANLTQALHALGCVRHERQNNAKLPRVVLWSCRQHDRYASMGPAERTRVWMDAQGYETLETFNEMN